MLLTLILVALPLDLVAPAPPAAESSGLKLEAIVDGRKLQTRLVNTSAKPVLVFVGLSCGGPFPFTLAVDGAARSFRSWGCQEDAPLIKRLAPGERWAAQEEELPAGREVVVHYRPDGERAFWCGDDCWAGELRATAKAPAATAARAGKR